MFTLNNGYSVLIIKIEHGSFNPIDGGTLDSVDYRCIYIDDKTQREVCRYDRKGELV